MIFRRTPIVPALLIATTPVGAESTWSDKIAQGTALLSYLDQEPALSIDSVEIRDEVVHVSIPALPATASPVRLVYVPPHVPAWSLASYGAHHPDLLTASREVPASGALVTIQRPASEFPELNPVLSRWMLVRQDEDGAWTPASRAAWPSLIHPARTLAKVTASTVKGVGGVDTPRNLEDLVELGIGHATVNVHLNSLLRPHPGNDTDSFEFQGSTFHIDNRWRTKLDETIGFLTRHDIVVSMILLVTPPRGTTPHPMIHPEALAAGTLAMPNLVTPEGCRAYAAALDFLAERYTREDARYGRVSNWIAHNEVDQAWTWTNMGEQPMPRLLEAYYRSMRLIHGTVSHYDQHARVFASFTHHWFHEGDGRRTYRTREMLKLLNRLSKAEGDFPWGIAYHPYPQNLFNPRTWDDTQVAFHFDTPKITMKNIEVLVAFLSQPEFRVEGALRPIMLSEQGFHTADYSAPRQDEQAAALVYTWHKLRALPAIEAFHYHRWFDNPHEGGLKLGLRTLPSPGHPIGAPKRGWSVYRALGTNAEQEASSFAKPLLGVDSFEAVPYRGPLPAPPAR